MIAASRTRKWISVSFIIVVYSQSRSPP
jgi:hypothetical protein